MKLFKVILHSIFCLLFLFHSTIYAQTAQIQWQKCFGGSQNDGALTIQQTSDGGLITAGYSNSNDYDVTSNYGNYDFWVVKTDFLGSIQWQKSYGGMDQDIAKSIQQTIDGGYIVAGGSKSNNGDVTGNHGDTDFWILKLDAAGIIEWQKSYGGSLVDVAMDIKQTKDSGYIIAGYTNSWDGDVVGQHGGGAGMGVYFSDYWIVKINGAGIIKWAKCYGGSTGSEYPFEIQKTYDAGYIVAGKASSHDGDVSGNHGLDDFWILKLDSNGIIQWKNTYGGSGSDNAESIQLTSEGGYIAAGFSNSIDGDVTGNHALSQDYWIVKLDVGGVIQWQKSLGGSGIDVLTQITQTADGVYIASGWSNSTDGDVTGNHGGSDSWIVKIDTIGVIQCEKSIGGTGDDRAECIVQTTDSSYVLAGRSNSTDGDVSGNHGGEDFWLVKLGITNGINELNDGEKVLIYPNPCRDRIYLQKIANEGELMEVSILNLYGVKIIEKIKCNLKLNEINLSELREGIYILYIKINEDFKSMRIIVQK